MKRRRGQSAARWTDSITTSMTVPLRDLKTPIWVEIILEKAYVLAKSSHQFNDP